MADTIIPGTIIAFAGKSIPASWELCDGREVSKDDPKYTALHRIIGNTWGGDNTPNFKLPDLRNQFLLGAATANEVTNSGGSASHNHGGRTTALVNADGYHADPNNRPVAPQTTGYLHNHSIDESTNLPPYKKVFYLIKL
jgi:Phage Tail Collar Domain